jgi:hypothetical protein
MTFHPDSSARPALDLQLQRDASDLLTSARCPACRAPLVARMTCRGPQFVCMCDEAKLRAAEVVKPPPLCAEVILEPARPDASSSPPVPV